VAARFSDPEGKNIRLPHENPWIMRNGDQRQIEWRCAAVPAPEGGGTPWVISIGVDVTDRNRTLEQLRLKDAAVESAISAIAIASLDGHLTYVNNKSLELWGYKNRYEVLGRSATDPTFWASPEQAATCATSVREEGSYIGELVAKRADGSLFDVHLVANAIIDENGLPIGMMASFVDISAQKRARMEMEKLSRAMEQIGDAIIITDANQGIEYVNGAFERITGYRKAEVIGRTPRILRSGEHDHEFYGTMWQVLTKPSIFQDVFINRRKDGTLYYEDKTITPVSDETGTVTHYIASGKDITDRLQTEERFERLLYYDPVTDLPNRRRLEDRLSRALPQARRNRHQVVALYVALDALADLIETLGQQAGEEILKEMTRRVRPAIRQGDTLGLDGANQFVIIAEGVSEDADLTATAHKIMAVLKQPVRVASRCLHITCSIGIAIYPRDADDPETPLNSAHRALSLARAQAPNSYWFFEREMNRRAADRLQWIDDLHEAVARDEFYLEYQPQVDVRTGHIAGTEVLIRWMHPTKGAVPPGQFIGILEQLPLIETLGEWILRTACKQTVEWHRAGLAPISVAVNVAARQLRRPGFAQRTLAILDEVGFDPAFLELELTENTLMSDDGTVLSELNRLASAGVHVALDDFGTGYSSLSYLRRFPVHKIKIDKSFIDEVTSNPNDAAIARTVIIMGQSLRLTVVAEGVETEAQMEYLRAHHCDLMQGYYLSRPLSPASCKALLAKGGAILSERGRTAGPERSLLIVDDEPNVIKAVMRVLRRDGYQMFEARDASQAFERLATQPVGLVIADQRMPGMNGTEFLRRVKGLYPDTVRMVLSGYTELQAITDAINEGAIYKFMLKPWDAESLRKNVAEGFRVYEAMCSQATKPINGESRST